jgi:Ca2+-binding RTX toxin-like protein
MRSRSAQTGVAEFSDSASGDGPVGLRVAQAEPVSDAVPDVTIADAGEIGKVVVAVGTVTLERADGSIRVAQVGTIILQNDVVITANASQVAITFTDGSVFSLSENGRMTLDEYIYSPDGGPANMLVGLLQGTLAVVSGQIAPTGTMEVTTPVATLGIRGTSVVIGLIGGDLQVALVTDVKDGEGGLVQIIDNTTGVVLQELTVGQIGQLFQLDAIGGQGQLQALTAQEQQAVQANINTLVQSYSTAQQNPIIAPGSTPQQNDGDDPEDGDRQGLFENEGDSAFAGLGDPLREFFDADLSVVEGGLGEDGLLGLLLLDALFEQAGTEFGVDALGPEGEFLFLLAGLLIFEPDLSFEEAFFLSFLASQGIFVSYSSGVTEVVNGSRVALIGDDGDTSFDIASYISNASFDWVAVSYGGDSAGVFVNLEGTPFNFGFGNPTVDGMAALDGAGGNDTFNAMPDAFIDSDFDDVFNVGGAAVVIELSAGDDTVLIDPGGPALISYFNAAAGVDVDLTYGTAFEFGTSSGAIGNDSFANASFVEGSDFADNLVGDGSNNFLFGGAGNDIIDGGAGNDLLRGGAGIDDLTGDAGIDTFWYVDQDIAGGHVDQINDFLDGTTAASDIIDIEDLLTAAFANAADFINVAQPVVSGPAFVQVDVDGAANGQNFQTIAQLASGVDVGDQVQFEVGDVSLAVLTVGSGLL